MIRQVEVGEIYKFSYSDGQSDGGVRWQIVNIHSNGTRVQLRRLEDGFDVRSYPIASFDSSMWFPDDEFADWVKSVREGRDEWATQSQTA